MNQRQYPDPNPEITQPCHFCQGQEARLHLAQALLSGKFQQQPANTPNPPMRDLEDRYTVTGAAASLSPICWFLLNGEWRAVWLDELTAVLPHRQSWESECRNLPQKDAHELLYLESGDIFSCPEITAHQLGLGNENGHPEEIWATVADLSPARKEELGINPKALEWPIDRMTFQHAATLILEEPQTLGTCEHDEECLPPPETYSLLQT